MKNIVVFLIMIMTMTQCTNAKQNVVIATYDKTIAIPPTVNAIEDIKVRKLAIEQLRSRSCTFTMVFNSKQYGFYAGQKATNGLAIVSGDNSIYIDFATGKEMSQKSILDKAYVVEGQYAASQWEINKQKTAVINGRKCIMASLKGDSSTIAWYCPDIPCLMGPNGLGGLPGLILKLETKSATFQIKELTLAADKPYKITSAQKGDNISQQDFNRIRDKKLKDLGVSGSGVHIIKM